MRVVSFGLVLACVVAACSGGTGALNGASDGGANASGTDGSATQATTDGAAGAEGGAALSEGEVAPSPHDPKSGCRSGFEACGEHCANLASDSRYCGDCSTRCTFAPDGGAPLACVDSACVPLTASEGCQSWECDGKCAKRGDIENCGSCYNRCGDRQLCYKAACADAKGDGKSCATALIIPDDDDFVFRYPSSLTSNHVFQCSGPNAVPTRWFKWTADGTQKLKVKINSPEDSDDYVVAAYSSADCDDAVLIGCNDTDNGGTLPELQVPVTTGKTYWIAVGRVSAKAGVNPSIHVDD